MVGRKMDVVVNKSGEGKRGEKNGAVGEDVECAGGLGSSSQEKGRLEKATSKKDEKNGLSRVGQMDGNQRECNGSGKW